MKFNSTHDADVRLLGNTDPVTPEEIREFMPYVGQLSPASITRLETELVLMQLTALKRQEDLAARQITSFDGFDKATAKVNWRMTGLTVLVLVVSLVQVGIAWRNKPVAAPAVVPVTVQNGAVDCYDAQGQLVPDWFEKYGGVRTTCAPGQAAKPKGSH